MPLSQVGPYMVLGSRPPHWRTVLGLASRQQPASYWDIIGRDNPRKGAATVRREPRRREPADGMPQDAVRPRATIRFGLADPSDPRC